MSRWNSWLESFRFHVNCIHFRGTVFIHVGPAQLCMEMQIFSLKDHEDLFWDDLQKGFHVFFCKRWTPFYEIKQDWESFCPNFQLIKSFRGALAPRLLHYWLAQNFRHSSTRVRLHLQWRLGVCSAAMSNPNGLLSQKVCHYLNQVLTLINILMRAAHWITYCDLRKLNVAKAEVLKAFES